MVLALVRDPDQALVGRRQEQCADRRIHRPVGDIKQLVRLGGRHKLIMEASHRLSIVGVDRGEYGVTGVDHERDSFCGVRLGVEVAAAQSADAVMGGAPGGVCRPADERGDLRVRQAGHMVVGDGLSLLVREGTERGPQVVVCWFPAAGCGLGFPRLRLPASRGGSGHGAHQLPCGGR